MAPSRTTGILATLAAAAVWGTSFPVNEWGLDAGLPPVTFVAGRFLLAAVITLPWLVATGRAGALWSAWPWALGIVNAVAFALQYWGQTIAPAGSSSFLVNVNAITVALLAWWFLGERPTRLLWGALALGVGGAVLLGVGDAGGPSGDLRGHLLVLAAGAVWSVYFVGTKHALAKGASPGALAVATFVATGVILAPALVVAPPSGTVAFTAIVYTGLACTVGAFSLWLWGLRAVGATVSAVALLLEVGVASTLGWLLLDESFPPVKLLGAASVLGAVVAVSIPHKKRLLETTETVPAG